MTIEERAKIFADKSCVGDAAFIVDLIHEVAEKSYAQGATDQRAIDIDKACKWLEENQAQIVSKTGVILWWTAFDWAFRKIMKEDEEDCK